MERTNTRLKLDRKSQVLKQVEEQGIMLRHVYFMPELDLYLTNLDHASYFNNPLAPPCLGRSQDWITKVEKVKLNSINQEIGNNETLVKQTDEKIRQLHYKLKNINYQTKNLEAETKNYEKLRRGMALAQKVQLALEEYEIRLKKEKIGQLSQSLLDCLNELMHKEVYHGVDIDPETFAVTLYNAQNHAIPKEQLSAGEKQIYAIAILWALARTSGRPLPFIVDNMHSYSNQTVFAYYSS